MTIRQPTPLLNLAILAGAKTIRFNAGGQRVTITNLLGADTLQCALDGGGFFEIAPGYPINTGLEQFGSVQFFNQNGADITFDAEIGWAERPDNRSYIQSAVEQKVANSIVTGPELTVPNGGHCIDIAASNTRKELAISNKHATDPVIIRDALSTTQIGTLLSAGQTAWLETTDAVRLVNPGTNDITVHYNEFKVA